MSNGDEFVLDGGDNKPKPKAQQPAPKQPAADDPFVLNSSDTQFVKKKDGTPGSSGSSAPTTSPSKSPDAISKATQGFQNKTLSEEDVNTLSGTDFGKNSGLANIPKEAIPYYVEKHNGPTKMDLVKNVQKNVFDVLYPVTQDPKTNQTRRSMMESVYTGDQEGIKKVKDAIITDFDQQIDKINSKAEQAQTIQGQVPVYNPAQQKQVDILKEKRRAAVESLDNYGMASIPGSPVIKAFEKDVLSSSEEAGKLAEKYYGSKGSSGNAKYDRTKTGMALRIQNLQMEINDLMSKGIRNKNQELLNLGDEKVKELHDVYNVYNNLDTDQFPDVGKANTARWIGEGYAKMFPDNTEITPEGVKQVAAKIGQDDPAWLAKYGKFINDIADSENQSMFFGFFKKPGLVPRGTFAGAVERGAERAVIGALKTRADIFGYEKDQPELDQWQASPRLKGTSETGEAPNKIIYDKEGKAYREVPNEHYGAIDFNNATRIVGESLPGLAAWMIPETIGAKLATSVGLGSEISQTAGLLAASYATQYDNNLKTADEIIGEDGSDAKKKIVANASTILTAGVFKLFGASPTKMAVDAISKGVVEDAAKLFAENGFKNLSEEQTSSFVKNSIVPRVKAISTKAAENLRSGAVLGAASVTDEKIQDMVKTIMNPKAQTSTPEENARTFGTQVLLMSVIGLPGLVKSGIESPSLKDAMYHAGTYSSQYIDDIQGRIDRGELDEQKGNQAIAAIKTLGEEVARASTEKDDEGRPLTTKSRKEIAIAGFRKRAAEMLAGKGHDTSSVQGEADAVIKEEKKENPYLPIEESPVFKSISEDQTGEKPTSIKEIDLSKNYTYDKEGEIVTTDGVQLINHLVSTHEGIEEPLRDSGATTRALKREPDKMIDALVRSGEITYTDEEGKPCAKEGLTTTSNPSFGGWEIVHDLKNEPSHNQGGVDLSIKGNTIEAEGRELVLKNKGGEMAIIPKKDRSKVSKMISDNCEECLNDYISKLPKNPDVAEDGGIFGKEELSTPETFIAENPVEKTAPVNPEEKDPKKEGEKGNPKPKEKTTPTPEDKIPAPDYNDPKSRLKYAESFVKKHGPLMQGRGDTPLRVNEIPRGGSDTAKNISTKVASKFGLDPETLYSSSMEEGMSGLFKDKSGLDSKHRKPTDFGYQSYYGDKEFPINGNESFGLPDFSKRFPELVKGGYLPKEFAAKFRGKDGEFSGNDFKSVEDAMTAKAALLKFGQDYVEKYASQKGIPLSKDAKNFFSLVLFNGGEGTFHQMIYDYNKNGLLKDDKFIDERPTKGEGLKADSYKQVHLNISRRIKMAKALKAENLF